MFCQLCLYVMTESFSCRSRGTFGIREELFLVWVNGNWLTKSWKTSTIRMKLVHVLWVDSHSMMTWPVE